MNWSSQTSASDNSWLSVTYGQNANIPNGLFVAVSYTGTGNRVMTSPDGITWTSRTSAADNFWTSVTYGQGVNIPNGLFVAVSNDGFQNRVMTSPDGITWTSQTTISDCDSEWNSITYANGLFVAVGFASVMTSPDGITWTSRTSAAIIFWTSVTYGQNANIPNGLFVAVAASNDSNNLNRVMTSPDGITWTLRTSASNNSWNSVTYGQGLFVAVARSGTGNKVMTSPDGITWTSRTSASDNNWASVTYGQNVNIPNGLFVAVANSGTENRVMTSPDGITWRSEQSASDNYWTSVTYGQGANIPNGLFVAVSANGFQNRVMTSSRTTALQVNNKIYIKSLTLMEILEGEFTLGEFENGGIPITVSKSKYPIISERITLFYKANDFKEKGISVDFLKERGFGYSLLKELGF
jgi:hypothetical protein